MSTPKLISFKLCPFVQRSVITLLEKKVEYEISYIDLKNKPDWFLKLSPTGKVPVLQIDDVVLFESAVINEYLDETNPPQLHPTDPLIKAKNRAWIEFSANLTLGQHKLAVVQDQTDFYEALESIQSAILKVEGILENKPYFNGSAFSLVDAAYAPPLMRIYEINKVIPLNLYERAPKVKAWEEALLNRASVKESVVSDFPELLRDHIKSRNSYLAQKI